jgi:glyoxylate/hydroxypyruvate reductase A
MSHTLLYLAPDLEGRRWAIELAKHVPDLELRIWPEIGDPTAIEAALVWRPPPGVLATLPRLRLIHALGAGVEHIFADPLLPRTVPVIRLVDPYMTAAMSEYVQCQVLRLHRQDLAYRAQQQDGVWRLHRQPNAGERRVGILGLGALGSDAALRLKVLGFDVAGWSRSERKLPGVTGFHGAEGLRAMLGRSEILICLLPLTVETEGILNAALFAALPKDAAIVNCARGAHLVDGDLLAALDRGHLSGAVLDVFRQEPLPADHPFWRHPRIVVTPHAAAATNPVTAAPIIAEALRRLADGKPLAHRADPLQGY